MPRSQCPPSYKIPCAFLALLYLSGCNSEIYLRDGVTDGDTFYLAEQALTNDDPVLQSWVSYSLTLSACKLAIGGDNPARVSSYDCELTARGHLLDTWAEQGAQASNDYLDTLTAVRNDGWLGEYVARFLPRSSWQLPANLNLKGFEQYRRATLSRHKPATRIVGSWNYARNVREP